MSDDFEFKKRRTNAADRERERDRLKKQRKRATAEGAEQNRVSASKGMQRLRAVGREVEIPAVVDPVRRESCRMDLVKYYFTYYIAFTYLAPSRDHIRILEEMQLCILYGTRKALGAPRGFGKDTLCMIALNWAMSYGHRKWPVLAGAKKDDAEKKLENVKKEWETNDLLLQDFPEIAAPIRALERSPQRAKGQRILDVLEVDEEGNPTAYFSYIKWGAEEFTFPAIHEAASSGATLTAASVDAAIRGKVRGPLRPDFAIANDVDTATSARSAIQCKARERVIEQDMLGLAGPGKSIGAFILCTILCKGCVADTFTDRTKKPAWNGERIAALKCFPNREDLWVQYMEMRREGQIGEDRHGREAHRFYLQNRAIMDAGAVVAWEERYDRNLLDDGESAEVSALQNIYNQRCDNGEEFFFSELQNDPLPENQDTIGLTPKLVASRCGGYASGIVPAGAVRVTRGIDVRARELHSVKVAWMVNGDSFIVDYARYDVNAPEGDLRDPNSAARPALEIAIEDALRMAQSEAEDFPMKDTEGNDRYVDMTLVDAGFLQDRICIFTKAAGPKYRPTKGYGTKQGQKRYAEPKQKSKNARPMFHCYRSKIANGTILYHVDADFWKLFTQLRFLQDPDSYGAVSLWGMDPAKHRVFSNHICAEQFDPETKKFIEESPHNHFLDATALANCAAGMLGIRIKATAAAPVYDGDRAPEAPKSNKAPRVGRRVKLPAPSQSKGGARVVKRPEGVW